MAKKIQETEFRSTNGFRNILVMSIAFMMMMAAWLTIGAIQQTILQSVREEDPSFTGDGYISMSLIQIVFAATNFFTPMVISFLGVRTTMVVGTLFYAIYIAGFLYPNVVILYSTSVLLGIAAPNVWVATGIYFTKCNTKETIGRNMGIYWMITTMGQLIGSGFVYWKFQGLTHIDVDTRRVVLLALVGVAVLSSAIYTLLGPPRSGNEFDAESGIAKSKETATTPSFCTRLTEPLHRLKNKHMLLLLPPSVYSGLETAYFLAIYPTAVGFTSAFGEDAKKLVGAMGIISGTGSLVSGLLFGMFANKVVNSRRDIIIVIGCLCHCVCIVSMYVNLSHNAPLGPTMDISWFDPPSVPLAVACSFFLGVGDGCVTPQIAAVIGVIWPDNPSASLAIFRSFQAASCAFGLYLSSLTGLYNQILILLIVTLLGTTTYFLNEKLIVKEDKKFTKAVMQISVLKPKMSLTDADGAKGLK